MHKPIRPQPAERIGVLVAAAGVPLESSAHPSDSVGLGYPHGPLAWGDLLGANTVLSILNNLEQQIGDPRYRPSPWPRRRALLGLSLHYKEI